MIGFYFKLMKASLYSRSEGLLWRKMLRSVCVVIFLVCFAWSASATHMRAGNIIVEKVGPCSARTYRITIVAYIDTESGVPFGGSTDFLYYGVGSERIVLPEIVQGTNVPGATWTMIDATRKIARVTYSVPYTYPGADTYTISYIEVNRNQGVLNMDQSVDTPFYIETRITIDPYLGCSTPAKIEVPPVDRACSGVAWFHNPGAYDDEDGDSISYQLVIPFSNRNQQVLNYRPPNAAGFYTDFATGNETDDGPPTFTMDPVRGNIVWDAPGAAGEYNIAFHIIEWREKDGQWYQTGYVRRDMQIIVEDDCNNERPELEIPEDICVRAGEVINESILGSDPDGNPVQIEAFSEVFGANFPNPASRTPFPPLFQVNQTMNFHWQTTCDHVKDQPYMVVFKVSDKPTNGSPQLATFKSWMIRVVGPEPKWNDRTVNTTNRSVTLNWKPYICQQAETMQIWRRVDSVQYVPDKCETGMPPNLGYTMIATVPVKNGNTPVVQYVDTNDGKGLSAGARYCYRLVAVYPEPKGGESIVSSDTCINPIIDDVPIITNVSVLKTGVTDGEIKVKWFKPQLESSPPPYRYEIYRAEGPARGNDSTLIATVASSTAIADSIVDVGINTEAKIYNYSVTAYSVPTSTLMGSSTPASSVRLETESEIGRIVLSWRADVPWSNEITGYRHRIYRGDEDASDDELVLIDSVEVTEDGLTYTDQGQFNNTPLEDGKTYCYRVETVGSYGNPALPARLFNFSQTICTQPGDSIPPCTPVVEIAVTPCEDLKDRGLLCDGGPYINTISWTNPDDPQCSDIRFYEVWVSSIKGGEFVLLPGYTISGTSSSFTDPPPGVDPLLSFARCYKLRAVDRSGNKSEFSNEVCLENCPHYELPNVFTPNGDAFNEFFSAYSTRGACQEGNCVPEETLMNLRQKCARFVEKVKFTVYNRWGQKVYDYESGGERTIYIDWHGKDNNGVELAPAVYFYSAEVTFDVVDPKKKTRIFKGWVHLLDDPK
jgi:hypothetical protein